MFFTDQTISALKKCRARAPASGEAVIRITLTTICGTDLHILRGEYPVKPGLVIGHEPVGVIEELGEGCVRIQNRRSRSGRRDHAVRSMPRLFVRAMGAMRPWRRCRSDRRLAIRQHHQRRAGRISARAKRAGEPGENSR